MARLRNLNLAIRYFYFLLAMMVWGGLTLSAVAENPTIGPKSQRVLYCMGQKWTIEALSTSVEDELLVKASDLSLMSAARVLGRYLNWNPTTKTLTGDNGLSLNLGQTTIKGKGLPLAPRMIDNEVYIPLTSLEELLSCRITVKDGKQGAIYLEPTIKSISLDPDAIDGTALHIETTVPVRKKVMVLNNPRRTVIDLIGVAPPRDVQSINHPVLGEIKIAHNQPAPSVTRIVIPVPVGVKVTTPKNFDLFVHDAKISWREGMLAEAKGVEATDTVAVRVPVVQIPKVTTTTREPVVKIKKMDGDKKAEDVKVQPAKAEVPKVQTPAVSTQTPAKSVQSNDERPQLLDVSWQNQQLKLSFSKPVSYQWSRLPGADERFILDLPGVIFPAKRQTLTSNVGGLDAVRIVQNMPEPDPIVRLVCDLSKSISVSITPGTSTELLIDFPGRLLSAGSATRGSGQTEKPKPGSANGRTICIDPGHGGSDPGALNRSLGVAEKQVTLDICLRLADMLRNEGWNVVMTRTTDKDVSYAGSPDQEELGARANLANQRQADLFVSVHCNSSANPNVGGTSIHWYKADDYRLAKSLHSDLLDATGSVDRGLIKDRFFVLARTEMPAVLIETAFISQSQEGKLLATSEYRERIARGILAGLRGYAASYFSVTAASK